MCGIVGYIGSSHASEILISGLEILEYRGYDSAGIFAIDHLGCGFLWKEKGRIAGLKKKSILK